MENIKIKRAAQCLIDLENHIVPSAYVKEWIHLKNGFISSVQRVSDSSKIKVLFEQLRLLESHVKYSLQSDTWRTCQRDDWRVMTDPNLDVLHDISHFISALKAMEQNLYLEAYLNVWNLTARDEWLKDCDGLIDPLLQHHSTSSELRSNGSMLSIDDDWVEVSEADFRPSQDSSDKRCKKEGTELELAENCSFNACDEGVIKAPCLGMAIDEIQAAVQCLKELESNIPKSAFSEEWESMRPDFISSIEKINNISTINVLFWELRALDSHLQYSKKPDISNQWEKMYWQILTHVHLDLSYTLTRFIITLKFLENNLLDETLTDEWKELKRNQWLGKCSSLIDPLLQLHFYEELLLKIDDILKEFGYETLKEYDVELEMVITFIDSVAQALDKVNTGTGIADTASGALGIAAGVLGGIGLILAPFTAGASTILTLTSLGVGVGSASTSLTSVIVQKVSDKRKLAEVQVQTEKITAETMSLVKVLENHANSVDELKEKLKSLGKAAALKYIKDVGSASSNLIFGSNNIFGIVTVARQIATQGFKTSVAFESAVPSVFRGTSSLASAASIFSGILSVVGIGFGIFGAVSGAKKIKNGSELAKSLRGLSENLSFAKDEIHVAHEKVKDSLVKYGVDIDDDAEDEEENLN